MSVTNRDRMCKVFLLVLRCPAAPDLTETRRATPCVALPHLAGALPHLAGPYRTPHSPTKPHPSVPCRSRNGRIRTSDRFRMKELLYP
jgi:hypothetical protein